MDQVDNWLMLGIAAPTLIRVYVQLHVQQKKNIHTTSAEGLINIGWEWPSLFLRQLLSFNSVFQSREDQPSSIGILLGYDWDISGIYLISHISPFSPSWSYYMIIIFRNHSFHQLDIQVNIYITYINIDDIFRKPFMNKSSRTPPGLASAPGVPGVRLLPWYCWITFQIKPIRRDQGVKLS